MNNPVFIVSYNRPLYLERTLRALKDSILASNCVERKVILIQDGSFSEYYRRNKTDVRLIDACVGVFTRLFPDGLVCRSLTNLGIGRNIYRAEVAAFIDMTSEAAIFFEDDLVVTASYISILDQMLTMACQDADIGMVSAYGADMTRAIPDQHRLIDGLGNMHHNWGYGLTRRHWAEREEYVARYMEAIAGSDYNARPYPPILRLYHEMGYPSLASNQDLFKNCVTAFLGRLRVTTETVNAVYIGVEGEHYDQASFSGLGFNNSAVFDHGGRETVFRPMSRDVKAAHLLQQKSSLVDQHSVSQSYLAFFGLTEGQASNDLKYPLTKGHVSLTIPQGMFEDGWFSQEASITFSANVNDSFVRIRGHFLYRLTSEMGPIEVIATVNSQIVGVLAAQGSESFDLMVPIEPSEEVRKIAISTTRVPSSQSLQLAPDKRPLVWRLDALEFENGATFSAADLMQAMTSNVKIG